MAQTLAEKILARHSGRDSVKPDDFVMAELDLVLGNDITAPVAIKEFHRLGAKTVFDKDKIALICDHFTLTKIFLLQNRLSTFVSLQENTTSPTSTTWAIWA